jgi:GAF domain-containing protein
VISRSGEVIGGLFFGHDRPGVFTQDAEEIVSGIAAHAAIAIDDGAGHRVSNAAQGSQEERAAFVARLRALANVHSLLTERNWARALVADVMQRAVAPFPRDRFKIEGPAAPSSCG